MYLTNTPIHVMIQSTNKHTKQIGIKGYETDIVLWGFEYMGI